MSGEEIPGWYEAGLPARERKRRGHFSTPARLVEQMLDACGYTAEHNLTRLRVLDPASGSGNFLAAAAHRLLVSGEMRGLSAARQLRTVQQNIWGFDPDPVACFLAETQLRTTLGEAGLAESSRESKRLARAHFHIHQGDGLAFSWQDYQGIDLFLANPPYLSIKNADLSGYSSARQRGQVDSYLLFMDLALQIVRPDGWIGLVLPDPFLARTNATEERQRLLTETTIHHLWHLSGVFAAHVGAVVLIAQKRPPRRSHLVPWQRGSWHRELLSESLLTELPPRKSQHEQALRYQSHQAATVPLTLLLRQPRGELRYLLSAVNDSLIGQLQRHLAEPPALDQPARLVLLGDLVSIKRGEELSKESLLLKEVPSGDDYPVLRGGAEVRPYSVPNASCWIARKHVSKPLERYRQPKLLVVKSTENLQAALDLRKHVVLQTLYLLSLRIPGLSEAEQIDELHFLLALLNSRLLRSYVYVLHTAYKWVQPQIEQHVLAHLPIPVVLPVAKAPIIKRARQLMAACEQAGSVVELEEPYKTLYADLYAEQEQGIAALYAAALQSSSAQVLRPSIEVIEVKIND